MARCAPSGLRTGRSDEYLRPTSLPAGAPVRRSQTCRSSLSSKLSPTATKGLPVEVGKTTSVLVAAAVISFLKSSGRRTAAAGGSALARQAGGPSSIGRSSLGGSFFGG